MSTPRDTVDYIASLAKLSFSDEQAQVFATQFDDILTYISSIEKLDLDGVPPLTQISSSSNVFREDVARPSLSPEDALSNAPKRKENFFKVPKVIEQSM